VGKRAALASSSGGGEQLHLRFTSSQATAARLALSLAAAHRSARSDCSVLDFEKFGQPGSSQADPRLYHLIIRLRNFAPPPPLLLLLLLL
jgi:hypothetical protein